jgi:Fe2+ or Zn2+ uptake regulation protein
MPMAETATPTPEVHVDDVLVTALRERGQRVTSQRLVINRALREAARHVTAEEVHDSVSERLPGVSLPTVYATLDLFEELGIVRRINAGGGAVLYDPKSEPHHHLVCSRCGTVEDLEQDLDLGRQRAMRIVRSGRFHRLVPTSDDARPPGLPLCPASCPAGKNPTS